MQYHHRQFGTVLVAILAATIIIMSLPLMRSEEFGAIQLEVVIVLLAAIALFYALTIEIREDTLFIRMGIGLIRRKVPLADIAQARKIRIPLIAGLGIHGIPGVSWVWNVSGRDGVQLDFVKGGCLIVGSDEPDVLVKAIESNKTI
jgi:hypothetical protein